MRTVIPVRTPRMSKEEGSRKGPRSVASGRSRQGLAMGTLLDVPASRQRQLMAADFDHSGDNVNYSQGYSDNHRRCFWMPLLHRQQTALLLQAH